MRSETPDNSRLSEFSFATYCRKSGVSSLLIMLAIAFGATGGITNAVFADDLGDFLGRRITRVDVVIDGATGTTDDLKAQLEVALGQDYSPVRIHESLVRLHKSGLASGARVEATAVGSDGVALTFIVKPQARIDAVVFEGPVIFQPGDLRARLGQLNTGDRLSEGAVSAGLDDLVAFYSSHGYYQAQVTSEVRPNVGGTRATVVYKINPGAQATVSRVTRDIRGEQVDLSKIKHALVEGKPFSQSAVEDEVEAIRQAYTAKDYLALRVSAKTAADMLNNSVAITIGVESGPRITVAVKGLDVSEKTKRELLPFYVHGGIDDFTLEEGRRRLLDHAQKEGYFFAEIARPALPDLGAAQVQIDYVVEPGSRYRLKDIDIDGLTAIPSADLQLLLKSKKALPISIFGYGRGVTSDDMLRQDANLIQRKLNELGYRRALVSARRGVSLTGENLIITFDVKEGPRSYVEQIGIRGNYVLTQEELRSQLSSVTEKAPLVTAEISRGADQLLAAYTNRGYAATEIGSELVDLGGVDSRDQVRVIYDVAESSRVRIRNVVTRGAALTDTGRLERDFYLFKENKQLKFEQFQETERALYETNAFNSITITSDPVGKGPDGVEERDVNVDVLESKRWLLIYGLGYQSSRSNKSVPGLSFLNGGRGLVQLSNSNLFGKLYTGTTQFRVSETELFAQMSFTNPRPFGINYPALVSVIAQRLGEKTFRTDRYTTLIQVERRLSHETIGYLSYNFERVSIHDLDGSIEDIERNKRPIFLGRIGPSFIRDSRDSFTDPKTGQLTVGSLYVASSILGGNEAFIKLQLEQTRYYPVRKLRDTVYSVSARIGLATPLEGKATLPISERFFAGGSRDLRGFGFEEAGPRDTVEIKDSEGNVVETREVVAGGNALFVVNNELRFPLWGPLGGTVFSDTGNVFRRVKDFRFNGLTETLGIGLRVKTPVGPVRFDVGFLVWNRPDGVKRPQFHFTLGQTF